MNDSQKNSANIAHGLFNPVFWNIVLAIVLSATVAYSWATQGRLNVPLVVCLGLTVLIGVSLIRNWRQREFHMSALHESENKFRTLLEASPAGVIAIQDDRILYVNDEAVRIVRAPDRDAFLGHDVGDVIQSLAPKSSRVLMDRLRRAENGESNPSIELEIVRADGSQAITMTRSVGVTLNGRPAVLQVFQDITERKQAEVTLRESEEKFSITFHKSPYPMAITEVSSRKLVEVNRALERVTGYKAEEIVGKTAVELGLLSAEDRESMARALQQKREVRGLEVDFTTRAGSTIHVLCSASIVDIAGKHFQITIIEDITNRRRTEQALRAQEEMIRSIVETSREWIWAIDLQGIHRYSNPAVEDILGRRPEELAGNSSFDLIHEDDIKNVEKMLPACIADKKGWNNLLLRWRHKNGSWRYLESNAVPTLNKEGDVTGFRGVDRDITERKKVEDAIRELVEVSSRRFGESYFETMVQELQRILEADYTYIGELQGSEGEFIRTIAVAADGELVDNFEYDLTDTPCEGVAGKSASAYASNVADRFPRDVLLQEMCVNAYVGVPLFNVAGHPRGIMVALYRSPQASTRFAQSILQIFSTRAGSEIERMQTEENLRGEQKRAQLYLDVAKTALMVIDLDERISMINREGCALLGYEESDLLGKNWFDICLPDQTREATRARFKTIMAGKEKPKDILERLVKTSSGELRLVEWQNTLLFEDQDRITGVMISGKDITERKKTEQALRTSEHKFRGVFDQSPHLTGLLSIDGTLLEANRTALDFAGLDREDVIGQLFWETPWWNHSPEESANIHAAILKAAAGDTLDLETNQVDAHGRLRDIYIRVGPFKDNDGTVIGMVPFGVDITDLKAAQRELLASRERLEALATELAVAEEKDRHRFSSYLHDQIGQSLAVIQMKLGALSEQAGAGHLTDSIEEISTFLEDVMDDTRNLTFDLSPPILYELGLSEALEWYGERTAEEHALQFFFNDGGQSRPLNIELAALIFRIARELLVNVVKHANADHLMINLDLNDDHLNVTIEDDGDGFDLSVMKPSRRSMRFGLFSIKERMRLVGGMLEIESSPGRGTRATLSVPLQSEEIPETRGRS